MRKIIITCAVTGAADHTHLNPAVPISPEEIANECLAAYNAGAAIVHIHVRDPKTGKPSMEEALYKEVVDRIRQKNDDVIINLTTGPGARIVLGEKDPLDLGAGTTLTTPEKSPSLVSNEILFIFTFIEFDITDVISLTRPTSSIPMISVSRLSSS